jgi:hypothetical protein
MLCLIARTQVPASVSPTTETAAPLQEFRAARVEVIGFDETAVLAALRLRLSRLPISRHDGPLPSESPHVYVQIKRNSDGTGALRVITSDGRAYERGFSIEVGQEVRVAASTTAGLIYAVEQGAVAPDREDVAIPEVPAKQFAAVPDLPATDVTPPSDVTPNPDPAQRRQGRAIPSSPWELAANLHGGAVLALGPPSVQKTLAGGGGGLGIELRTPRGGLLALDLRGIGLGADGLGVGRFRVSVGGGYAWRRGRLELPVIFALALEPWWATRAGKIASIGSGTAEVSSIPLIGGYLRLSPGLRLSPSVGPLVGLRIGPRLEIGGGFTVDGGARVVRLTDGEGNPLFRLGGLEVSIGLELTVQFAVRRARPSGSATRSDTP